MVRVIICSSTVFNLKRDSMPGNKGDSSFSPFLIPRPLFIRLFGHISFSFSFDDSDEVYHFARATPPWCGRVLQRAIPRETASPVNVKSQVYIVRYSADLWEFWRWFVVQEQWTPVMSRATRSNFPF